MEIGCHPPVYGGAATREGLARIGLSARRPPADMLGELCALRDLGVAHVILETRQRDASEMADTYERFATEVRVKLESRPSPSPVP
jgi:hypothetical protein